MAAMQTDTLEREETGVLTEPRHAVRGRGTRPPDLDRTDRLAVAVTVAIVVVLAALVIGVAVLVPRLGKLAASPVGVATPPVVTAQPLPTVQPSPSTQPAPTAPPATSVPATPHVVYGHEAPGRYDVTGVAAGDELNVRRGPGTAYPVIAALAPGATGIESTGRNARVDGTLWREILVPGGGSGWVHAGFLAAAPAPPEVIYGDEPRGNWDVTAVTADDVLNVHSGPGAHQPTVATLAADAGELESTGRIAWVNGVLWRELIVPGDGTGWVNASYLTETAPPPEVVYGTEPPGRWGVTGIAAGDVLNVRTGPGVHNPVRATLPPDATGLESTRRTALVDGVLWRELSLSDGSTGWVNASYLADATPTPAPNPPVT